jgi:hypothetical protein
MHDRVERHELAYWQRIAFINDPHFLRNGEARNRPRYRPGDLVVIYLSGTRRCPAVVRITGTASFEPQRVEDSAQTRAGDSGRWGWVTDVEPIAQKSLADAPAIEAIGVESRRLMRRARLRLAPEQYDATLSALRS